MEFIITWDDDRGDVYYGPFVDEQAARNFMKDEHINGQIRHLDRSGDCLDYVGVPPVEKAP